MSADGDTSGADRADRMLAAMRNPSDDLLLFIGKAQIIFIREHIHHTSVPSMVNTILCAAADYLERETK